MIEISDQEAADWPLDEEVYLCIQCSNVTRTTCGYCGLSLCDQLDCIKSHAADGCYTRYHADHSQADGNQNPSANAGPPDNSSSPSTEPAVDGQATEQ